VYIVLHRFGADRYSLSIVLIETWSLLSEKMDEVSKIILQIQGFFFRDDDLLTLG